MKVPTGSHGFALTNQTSLGRFRGHGLPLTLLLLYSAPFSLPALQGFFTFDDLMNLYYYSNRPLMELIGSVIDFWIPYRRPVGGVVYLSIFHLAGLSAWPYYLFGILIYSANLVLVYFLFFRLTRRRVLSVAASALFGIHPHTATVIYNFGAVYELVALGLMLVSIHLYLSYREAGPVGPRFYWTSLAVFILALGAKEIAVTTPLVLLLYELNYRIPFTSRLRSFAACLLRLTPFLLLAGLFSVAKLQVAEEQWGSNPAYSYQLGEPMYHNLHGYLELVFMQKVRFNDSRLAWALIGVPALALLLRNRHMLMGWSMFLILLLPVLGLPRIWGLFLYIPLVGLGLFFAALLIQVGEWLCRRRLWGHFMTWQIPPSAPAWGLALFLAVLVWIWSGPFSVYRDKYLDAARERRQFATQLFSAHPSMSQESALLFEGSPFESWDLNFLIWLGYCSSEIRVFRAPEQKHEFEVSRRLVTQSHTFRYSQGLLLEDTECDPSEKSR